VAKAVVLLFHSVIDSDEHRKKAREREEEEEEEEGVGDCVGDLSESRHHGEEQVSYTFCIARNAWD
jgi:hypothetical protein